MYDKNSVKRTRIFADTDVELSLVIRYAIFGLACVTYFSFMLVCNQWVQMPDASIQDFFLRALEDATYWLPGFLLMAPLAVHDFIKSCGRVSKPVVRLRTEMKLLIDRKSDRPIDIRSGEAWPELLALYNNLRGELLTLRREVSEYEALLGNAAISELNQSLSLDETQAAANVASASDAATTGQTPTSLAANESRDEPRSNPTRQRQKVCSGLVATPICGSGVE